jgi:2-dehydro-3-deoxyphosphogluconate aldolase / (4S)-4-hydroxy-2-oxoglutarate aldolase
VPDAGARIAAERLVAVLRVGSPELVEPTVAALAAGGVGAVELTFTTPRVAQEIARARRRHPELLIGAGTIREGEQARAAAAAGADFLVSPHLDLPLLAECLDTGLTTIPGVLTPSELAAALDGGAQLIKLFPASTAGPAHLRALLGPFPGVRVVPTGGIALPDVGSWLEAGAIAVGIGGELCSPALIEAGRFDELSGRAERFRAAVGPAGRQPAPT